MSEWWKTAKKILSGKPRGSKLIVLGIFLMGIGISLQVVGIQEGGILTGSGAVAFGVGIGLYAREMEYELEKKREKDAQKRVGLDS